jgi:hypothetical protein
LASKHICMIVGMHFRCTGHCLTLARGGKRLGIGSPDLHDPGSVTGNSGDLYFGRQRRHKDFSLRAEGAGGVSHRHSMIAAGRRYDPRCRQMRRKQAIEGTARLETARVL